MDRKLTAILYADVAGYSRLTGADDEGTVETLKVHLGAFKKAIETFGGRIVNTAGDAVLAEFASVVTALKCAVEAQRDLAERNKDLPENRKLQFRVGVNLGDIVVDGEEIYGDGINVAARLETLADPGGICISGRVEEQVEDKLDVGFAYLGAQSVKNIKKPVNVYKVLLGAKDAGKIIDLQKTNLPRWRWPAASAVLALIVAAGIGAMWLRPSPLRIEPASIERMAFPLPDKPSIAVLPFDNLSGDPEQEYLADGMTETLIATFSQIPELFVVARNSVFTYKDKPTKVQHIAEELGVRYVLEGSIQRSGERIRVTAQLIDAISGRHIWSKRYDRQLADLFEVQDEIAFKTAVAAQVQLTEGDQARIYAASTKSVDAWSTAIQGFPHWKTFTKEGLARAREFFEKAVALDPDYADAWVSLGWTHLEDARAGYSTSPQKSFQLATEYANKALVLDADNSSAYLLLGSIQFRDREYENGIATTKKALELSPSGADVLGTLARNMHVAGRHREAVEMATRAMRFNPHYPTWYLLFLARSQVFLGDLDAAIGTAKAGLERAEGPLLAAGHHVSLAFAYAEGGRTSEAGQEVEEALALVPNLNIENYGQRYYFKNPADWDRFATALRKAGLPERPPLPLPDKPSIAVLPFDNLTGDPEQEYLVDGFTETIIGALSRLPELIVIARNSTFTYKGKPTRVQDVGRDLGVRYVLEGSIQRAEQRIRVTVQLIDTKTGHHLWSERYDREISDIFAVQDEIAFKTAVALEVKLTQGAMARVISSTTDNLEAWTYYVQSLAEYRKLSKEGKARSRELAQKAAAIDPEFAGAWLMIGWTQLDDARFAWGDDREKALEQATETAEKIAVLTPDFPSLHNFLGSIYLSRKEYERAIAEKRRAIELSPSNSNYYASTGRALYYMGEYDEAISMMKQAKRFDPRNPTWHLIIEAASHIFKGEYDKAIAASQEGLQRAESRFMTAYHHVVMAFAYAEQGQIDKARDQVEKARAVGSYWTIGFLRKRLEFKDPAPRERFLSALRIAGMPENKAKQ